MINYHEAHNEALNAAKEAAQAMSDKIGGDRDVCGFAWAKIYVDGRTKVAKQLKKIPGWGLAWHSGALELWNPSKFPVQSVSILEAGARAYAEKFNELTGLKMAYGSRLD